MKIYLLVKIKSLFSITFFLKWTRATDYIKKRINTHWVEEPTTRGAWIGTSISAAKFNPKLFVWSDWVIDSVCK